MELGLAGRVALVCGSTKGLGRAVAKALAQEGARVAINGRHQDSVERVAQQLEAETSRTVVPLVADVGTPAEAEGMVERLARELGRLDIPFCNASGPPAAPFSHPTAAPLPPPPAPTPPPPPPLPRPPAPAPRHGP